MDFLYDVPIQSEQHVCDRQTDRQTDRRMSQKLHVSAGEMYLTIWAEEAVDVEPLLTNIIMRKNDFYIFVS